MYRHFFGCFYDPPAKDIAERQLREAEADRLKHLASAEYHRAMSDMLGDRITRLKLEAGDAS